MWMFLPYMKLYSKTSWTFYQQLIYQNKTKVQGENEQVPGLPMRKDNRTQAIWRSFLTELIKVFP